MSQAELAQHVSISPQAVGKWERGESMPDIATLNRLAEIFHVDLNYFSDSFDSSHNKTNVGTQVDSQPARNHIDLQKSMGSWDMSKGNWVDADFSGLHNLKEKFSASNIKNCGFLNSDLSGLELKNNYIEACDFSNADLRNSQFEGSVLVQSHFLEASFIDTVVKGCEVKNCDFTATNFSGAEIYNTNFQNNTIEKAIWQHTLFKGTSLDTITFQGAIEDGAFENCGFRKVLFRDVTFVNTFFKNNRKMKNVTFENCAADKISYAFLKNNQADVSNIKVID